MSNPLYDAAYGTLATPAAIAAARAVRPRTAPPQPQDPAYEEPSPQGARSLASPRAIAAYNSMRGIPQGTPTSQMPQTAMEAAASPGESPLTPEQPEMSFGARVGGGTLNAVAGTANLLDLPGSVARDLVTLLPGGPAPRNPFDQLLDPTGKNAAENRIEGRQILRDYGLVSRKKDTWGNFAAGIALEVATDPLTYLGSFGLTKAGEVFAKMGVKKLRPLAKEMAELTGPTGKWPTWVGGQFAKAAVTGKQVLKHADNFVSNRVADRVSKFVDGKQIKSKSGSTAFDSVDDLPTPNEGSAQWALVDDGKSLQVYKSDKGSAGWNVAKEGENAGKIVPDAEGTRVAQNTLMGSALRMTPRQTLENFKGIYAHMYGKDLTESQLMAAIEKDLAKPMRSLVSVGAPFSRPWGELTLKDPDTRWDKWLQKQPDMPPRDGPLSPPPATKAAKKPKSPSPDAQAIKQQAAARGAEVAKAVGDKTDKAKVRDALRMAGYADTEVADDITVETLGKLGILDSNGKFAKSSLGENATRVMYQGAKAFQNSDFANDFKLAEGIAKSWANITGKNADEYFAGLNIETGTLPEGKLAAYITRNGEQFPVDYGPRLIRVADRGDGTPGLFMHELGHDIENMFREAGEDVLNQFDAIVESKLPPGAKLRDENGKWTVEASEALANALEEYRRAPSQANESIFTPIINILKAVKEWTVGRNVSIANAKTQKFLDDLTSGKITPQAEKKTLQAGSSPGVVKTGEVPFIDRWISSGKYTSDEVTKAIEKLVDDIASGRKIDPKYTQFYSSHRELIEKALQAKADASKVVTKPPQSDSYLNDFKAAIRERFKSQKDIDQQVKDIEAIVAAMAKANDMDIEDFLKGEYQSVKSLKGLSDDALKQQDPVMEQVAREFDETAKSLGGKASWQAAKDAGATNLNYRQWVEVRTPAFKNWFGDWENDAANASKVVDPKTGEPLVVYHGTGAEFTEFDPAAGFTPGSWFTSNESAASDFGRNINAYLSIKSPATLNDLASSRRRIIAAGVEDGLEFNNAVISELQRLGFDGINDPKFSGAGGTGREVWAALSPTQIKSATANRGTFDPSNPNILFQGDDEAYGELYYKTERMLSEGKVGGKTNLQQFKATAKKYGVKDEELEDLDIDGLFSDGKPKTQQEISNWIRSNSVRLEELKRDVFGDYVVPGGVPGTYREKLIILADSIGSNPQVVTRAIDDGRIVITHNKDMGGVPWSATLKVDRYDEPIPLIVGYAKTREELISNLEGDAYVQRLVSKPAEKFEAGHFDVPNVLAHVRMDDIELPDGKKALRVQEIQSDWHQKGKDAGYKTPPQKLEKEIDKRTKQAISDGWEADGLLVGGIWRVRNERSSNMGMFRGDTKEDAIRNAVRAMISDEVSKIPDGPFKKSWARLALKSVLREAAEKGYDEIHIVKGSDIAKAVGGPVEALSTFYDEILNSDMKQLTKKWGSFKGARNNAKASSHYKSWKSPSQGYNRWLLESSGSNPFAATIEKTTEGRWIASFHIEDVGSDTIGVYKSLDEAKSEAQKYFDQEISKHGIEQHGFSGDIQIFSITPRMRKDLLEEGQPLYQKSKGGDPRSAPRGAVIFEQAVKDAEVFARVLYGPKADISTVLHELAHVARRRLKDSLRTRAEELYSVSGGKWTRDQEEAFARDFEVYLKTGKAPELATQEATNAMLEIFQRMKEWLDKVVKAIKPLPAGKQDFFNQLLGGKATGLKSPYAGTLQQTNESLGRNIPTGANVSNKAAQAGGNTLPDAGAKNLLTGGRGGLAGFRNRSKAAASETPAANADTIRTQPDVVDTQKPSVSQAEAGQTDISGQRKPFKAAENPIQSRTKPRRTQAAKATPTAAEQAPPATLRPRLEDIESLPEAQNALSSIRGKMSSFTSPEELEGEMLAMARQLMPEADDTAVAEASQWLLGRDEALSAKHRALSGVKSLRDIRTDWVEGAIKTRKVPAAKSREIQEEALDAVVQIHSNPKVALKLSKSPQDVSIEDIMSAKPGINEEVATVVKKIFGRRENQVRTQIIREVSGPQVHAKRVESRASREELVKSVSKEDAIQKITADGAKEEDLFIGLTALKAAGDPALEEYISTARNKILDLYEKDIASAVGGVARKNLSTDEKIQIASGQMLTDLIDNHNFIEKGKLRRIPKQTIQGSVRKALNVLSPEKPKLEVNWIDFDKNKTYFRESSNAGNLERVYSAMVDELRSGAKAKTYADNLKKTNPSDHKLLMEVKRLIKAGKQEELAKARTGTPVKELGSGNELQDAMAAEFTKDIAPRPQGELDAIAAKEAIEDAVAESEIKEFEQLLSLPDVVDGLSARQRKVVDALFEQKDGKWVRKTYGISPDSSGGLGFTKFTKKQIQEKAAEAAKIEPTALRQELRNIANKHGMSVLYKSDPQTAAAAQISHRIARPSWNEVLKHVQDQSVVDTVLQSLDVGENMIMSSRPMVKLAQLFDRSVLNTGDYDAQEMARKRWSATESAIYGNRLLMYPVVDFLGQNRYFDTKEIATKMIRENKMPRDEALKAARKLVNSRDNDIRRFLESPLERQHNLQASLFDGDEAKTQELQKFLQSLKAQFPKFLNAEQSNGLMSRLLFDVESLYYPRNKTEPGRALRSRPQGESLMSTKMDSQMGREDSLRHIPDGTAILNEMSVDEAVSGIFSKNKANEGPLDPELMAAAKKHVIEKYGLDKLISKYSRLKYYNKAGELTKDGEEKLEAIINTIARLPAVHAESQIPMFGHNFLRDFAGYTESHYTKTAIGMMVQDLVAKSRVSANPLDQKNWVTTLYEKTALDTHRAYINTLKLTDNYNGYVDWAEKKLKNLAAPENGKKPKIEIKKDGSVRILEKKHRPKYVGRDVPKGSHYKNVDEFMEAKKWGKIYTRQIKLAIDSESFEAASTFLRAWTTVPAVSSLVQIAGAALNTFKSMVTLPFLAFHTRNFMSGHMQNVFYGAFDPTDPLRYQKPVRQALTLSNGNVIKGISNEIPRFILERDDIFVERGTPAGDQIVSNWLRQKVFQYGITGDKQGIMAEKIDNTVSSLISQDPGAIKRNPKNWFGLRDAILDPTTSMSQKLNPIGFEGSLYPSIEKLPGQGRSSVELRTIDDTTNVAGAVGGQLSLLVENVNRIAPMLAFMKQGMLPEEAARMVNRIQFDYSNVSDFERRNMKQLIPFYTFTSKALKLTLGDLVTNPGGKQAWSIRVTNRLQDRDEPIPEHIRRGIAIPLPDGPGGEDRYLSGFGLAWEDPIELTSFLYGDTQASWTSAYSKLRPEIQGAGEAVFGKSAFFGRDLTDMDPQLGRLRDNLSGKERKGLSEPLLGSDGLELLSSKLPTARAVSAANTAMDDRKSALDKFLNLATGFKVSTVNEEARERILMDRYNEAQKAIGAREMNIMYTPDWLRERLPPEQIEQLNQLNELKKALDAKRRERQKLEKANALKAAATTPSI